MRGRNIRSKKKEVSLLAKTIKSLKEDNEENDFNNLESDYCQKTYDKNLNRNSSLKIFAYNQKKFFPNYGKNCKYILFLLLLLFKFFYF